LPISFPLVLNALMKTSAADNGAVQDDIRKSQTSLLPALLVRFAFPSKTYSSGVIPVPVGIAHTSTL